MTFPSSFANCSARRINQQPSLRKGNLSMRQKPVIPKMIQMGSTLLAMSISPTWAADFSSLPDATAIVPTSFSKVVDLPLMGEIWADSQHPETGPRYCVYDAKVLCVFYTFPENEIKEGKSWYAFAGLGGLPPANHIEFEYQGKSFGSGPLPRYALKIFFVSEHDLSDVRPAP